MIIIRYDYHVHDKERKLKYLTIGMGEMERALVLIAIRRLQKKEEN